MADSGGLVVVGVLGTIIAFGLLGLILYFNGLGVYGNGFPIGSVIAPFLEAAGIFILVALIGIAALILSGR